VHRVLKASLTARCASPDWVAHLPWFLLSFRATPHDKSDCRVSVKMTLANIHFH
jgi:hypothetical protein